MWRRLNRLATVAKQLPTIRSWRPRNFRRGVTFAAACGLGVASVTSWAWNQFTSAESAEPSLKDSDLYMATNDESDFCIFSGSSNQGLANEVATLLGNQLGRVNVDQFRDGEIKIRFLDSVRGKDVYLIQPTCAPPNDNLMQLLLMISTARRASANNITAIVPYFGYSRQLSSVNKDGEPVSLGAADVALMMKVLGVDKVVSIDLHKDQIKGFFDSSVQVENLDTVRPALPYLMRKDLKSPVVVSVGRVKKTKHVRDVLTKAGVNGGADMGFIFYTSEKGVEDVDEDFHPDIDDPKIVREHHVEFVGDVKDKDVVIVTDMVDSGSRVTSAANHLSKLGARRIFALATHGLFTNDAIESIEKSALDEVIMFNTIPLPEEKNSQKIRTLTASRLIAETIRRMQSDRSITELY